MIQIKARAGIRHATAIGLTWINVPSLQTAELRVHERARACITHHHAIVWTDLKEARIFRFNATYREREHIRVQNLFTGDGALIRTQRTVCDRERLSRVA